MKKKIFCFPYAGGSSPVIYSKWRKILKPEIELIPVELPGRGILHSKTPYKSINETVNHLVKSIECDLNNCEYGLWGHSMGGFIVYEMCRKIESIGMKKPNYLLISGSPPPHIETNSLPSHDLPEDIFIKSVESMNGTPVGLFSNDEFKKIFLPILRNDFKMVNEYRYVAEKGVCSTPIITVMGKVDKITDGDIMKKWDELTQGSCEIIVLDGNHFFINQNIEEMAEIIRRSFQKNYKLY